MKSIRVIFLLSSLFSSFVHAAGPIPSPKLAASKAVVKVVEPTADELGAQAFLEEVLNRRFTQNLSTLVEKQSFYVSTQVQLAGFDDDPDNAPAIDEKPSDLTLGYLDAEQLVKKYGLENEKAQFGSLLANKKIKSLMINVGLSENLGANVKQEVESWMQAKLSAEFGNKAKLEVAFIKMPIANSETKAKPWWDWLAQFQQLAGVLVLALTGVIGILVWRMTTSKSTVDNQGTGSTAQFNLNSKNETAPPPEASASRSTGQAETLEETRKYLEEIFLYSQKINLILPKVQNDFDTLLQTWCAAGNDGYQKVVCFAEVVGKDIGRLPIPADATQEVAAAFSRMYDLPLKIKQSIVEKIYWDLITIINLGMDSLAQPFGYLAGSDPSMINQMLIEENPKMKTMVSIYAPDDVRQKMFAPLDDGQKLEILKNASELSSITQSELKSLNKAFQNKMKVTDGQDNIQLGTALDKIVSALTKIDELLLLPQLQGYGIQMYKRKNVSVAFLHEWPDNKLGLLMSQLKTDHILTYLRLKPDMKDRILSLCQPRAAAVIGDEIGREDRVSAADKESHLLDIAELMYEFKENGSIDFDTVFPMPTKVDAEKSNVKPFRTA